jgi:2-polyprenyl-6-methoxyphenol hydroxylase-like FAD-dependent oxidoreductase
MAVEDGTVLGRCFAAAADVAEALARYEATRKSAATPYRSSHQKAEELMAFTDEEALPFRNTGGPPDYDPGTVPLATKEETMTHAPIEETQ